jgi:predicted RNase H-like HicB family nuclease
MNPLLTSALLSTGKQVIDHCLTKVDKESTEGEEFSKVLNKKIKESFEVPRYMHENGLQTPEEVVQHIQELKARLLESREMQNTALPHQKPNATMIVSRDGGYSVRNGDLEVTVAVDSQAHELAKAIHHLEGWLQNR